MKIEQEFFEAFGIEPELNCKNCLKFNDGESIYGAKGGCYDGSKETKKCYSLYPPITPEIKIKLIEMIIKIYGYITKTQYKYLLKCCIYHKKTIQDQVRGLFQ